MSDVWEENKQKEWVYRDDLEAAMETFTNLRWDNDRIKVGKEIFQMWEM